MKNEMHQSELLKLSGEQLARVVDWLDRMTLEELVEKLARPEPEGFGIRTSESALSRLRKKARTEEWMARRDEVIEQARAVGERNGEEVDFGKATVKVLRERLFEVALTSQSESGKRELLRLLLEHELRVERLAFEREKFAESKRRWEFELAAGAAEKEWAQRKEKPKAADEGGIEEQMRKQAARLGVTREEHAVAGEVMEEYEAWEALPRADKLNVKGEFVHEVVRATGVDGMEAEKAQDAWNWEKLCSLAPDWVEMMQTAFRREENEDVKHFHVWEEGNRVIADSYSDLMIGFIHSAEERNGVEQKLALLQAFGMVGIAARYGCIRKYWVDLKFRGMLRAREIARGRILTTEGTESTEKRTEEGDFTKGNKGNEEESAGANRP